MPANTRIQVRRGTASTWTNTNPNVVLSAGEIGYETDTRRIKIGDGSTIWTSLDYNAVVPSGFLAGSGLSVSVAADGSTVIYSLSDPTIQVADITDFADGVNDRVDDLLTSGSNIQLIYTDSGNDSSTLQIAVTGVSLSGHTHNLSAITDVTASVTEVNYLDLVTGAGTVDATKAVVVDSSKNITGFNDITASGFIGNGSSLTSLNASNLSSGTVGSGLLPNVTVGSTATSPNGSFVSSVLTDAKGRVTSVNTTTHTLATTSTQGIASFDSGNFSVAAGAVIIKASGVGNSQLENDRVTIGATSLVLGTTISAISGVSAASPVTLTFFVIDGGTA